ncbi:Unknown protein, partial [Striga hermonthica]
KNSNRIIPNWMVASSYIITHPIIIVVVTSCNSQPNSDRRTSLLTTAIFRPRKSVYPTRPPLYITSPPPILYSTNQTPLFFLSIVPISSSPK